MVLPSGVIHLETFFEKIFIFKELRRLFSSFEEKEVEVEEAEGACIQPGGKTKLSEELHSELEDFKSSMLSMLHTEALEESGRGGREKGDLTSVEAGVALSPPPP